jgi:hypothetical protein
MFVDASAIVAILTREPEADELADLLDAARAPITSPIAFFEAALGICRKLMIQSTAARGCHRAIRTVRWSIKDRPYRLCAERRPGMRRRERRLALRFVRTTPLTTSTAGSITATVQLADGAEPRA